MPTISRIGRRSLNLAFDGLGLALNTLLAGRLSLIGTVVLLASSMAALSRVLYGRVQPFCLIGFLALFSEPFAWGFVNLMLGFGLTLWVFRLALATKPAAADRANLLSALRGAVVLRASLRVRCLRRHDHLHRTMRCSLALNARRHSSSCRR